MVLNLFCASINTAWAPIYYDLADTAEGRAKLPRLTTVYRPSSRARDRLHAVAPDLLLCWPTSASTPPSRSCPSSPRGYYFFALYMVVSTPIFHKRRPTWAPIISGSAAA